MYRSTNVDSVWKALCVAKSHPLEIAILWFQKIEKGVKFGWCGNTSVNYVIIPLADSASFEPSCLGVFILERASHTCYRALGPELIPVYRQLTISHPPGGRLPVVTFPAADHHCPLAGTKLYGLVTEVHRCEQLAQGSYAALTRSRIWTHDLLSQHSTRCTTMPPHVSKGICR